MTVEDIKQIDFARLDEKANEVKLVISDHLGWERNELDEQGEHLLTLQEKLNSYLAFIESGEIYQKIPQAVGRSIVIQVVGKYPLSEEANKFYRLAGGVIEDAGFSLRFTHFKSASD
jgi:hypothetical protein